MQEGKRFGGPGKAVEVSDIKKKKKDKFVKGAAINENKKKKKNEGKKYYKKKDKKEKRETREQFLERQERNFRKVFLPEDLRVIEIKQNKKELKDLIQELSLMYRTINKETKKLEIAGVKTFSLDALHKSIPKKEKKEFGELKNFFLKNENHLLALLNIKVKYESVLTEEERKEFEKLFLKELPAKLKALRNYYYKYGLQAEFKKCKNKIEDKDMVDFYSNILPLLSLEKQKGFFKRVDARDTFTSGGRKGLKKDLISFRKGLFDLLLKNKDLLNNFNEEEFRKFVFIFSKDELTKFVSVLNEEDSKKMSDILNDLTKELIKDNKDHSKGVFYGHLRSVLSKKIKPEVQKPKVKEKVKVVTETAAEKKAIEEKRKLTAIYKDSANKKNKKINFQDAEARSLGIEFSFNNSKVYLKDKLDRVESNLKNDEKKLVEEREERLKLRDEFIKKRALFLKRMRSGRPTREKYFERKLGRLEKPTIEDVIEMQREEKESINIDDLKNDYLNQVIEENKLKLATILGNNDVDKGSKDLAKLILQKKKLFIQISVEKHQIQKALNNKKGNYKEQVRKLKETLFIHEKDFKERNLHLRSLVNLL
jgi:hypothetical protein